MTLPLARDLPEHADLVLAGRPLRSGVRLELTSRFADDTWRLEPAVLQQHVQSLALTFLTVPARYRLHAKQLCYGMLAGPLPPGERRQTPVSIRGIFSQLKKFLRWLHDRPVAPGRPASPDLAALTGADLLEFLRHLHTLGDGEGNRENARRAVCLLWRYRQSLSDPLLINPRQVEGWMFAKSRELENTTGRIPEPVLGTLITWALRFVDEFAPDIFMGQQCWRDYRARFSNGQPGRCSGMREDLKSYLDSHVRLGRPLPGHLGQPNRRFIAIEIGANGNSLGHAPLPQMIQAAFEEVGATDYTWLRMSVAGQLDGQPWINGIALRHPTQSLAKLARMLQVCCYIVIAFLSGMRDSEVKHLRRGCVTVLRDADGRPYRWKLTGLAFKGENDPSGTKATWVIGAPAARAIQVLEQLQPADQPLLFAHLPHAGSIGPATSGPNLAQTTKCTNAQLAELVDWINTYCAEHGRDDRGPLVNGQPWTLSTRQFRRTLAWFIARQPGGSIAGAIQYRHLSVQMFEGYAGTSDSGFRAEVESEQALARGEHLLAMTDAHEHDDLAGPAADEAARRLDEFVESARFTGTVITDVHRLKRLMRRRDPEIYPGTFATCVFNPDKALCQQHRDSRGTAHPSLGNCRPLECGNVALTSDNIDALRHERDQISDELAVRPGLPPLLVHRLRSRHEQLTQFLNRHTLESA